jgi:serine/threonine protein phosphatase PrpC
MGREDGKPKTPEPNLIKKEGIKVSHAFYSVACEKHSERNEDAVLIDDKENVFGVFDGMGGHAAGDVASQTAKSFILNNINGLIPPGIPVEQAQSLLVNLIVRLNDALKEKAISDLKYEDMGTTMSLVKIHEEENGKFAVFINVGDSRIYKFNKSSGLEQASVDDDVISISFAPGEGKIIAQHLAEAVDLGELNEYEQQLFLRRNQITEALPKINSNYTSHMIEIIAGDKILITSDGVHDNLTYTEIKKILEGNGSDEDLAKELVNKAVERSREKTMRSKKDDMSAIVISIK